MLCSKLGTKLVIARERERERERERFICMYIYDVVTVEEEVRRRVLEICSKLGTVSVVKRRSRCAVQTAE